MPLPVLQQRLQSLYEIELDHRVEDYLVTDPRFVGRVEGESSYQPREKLLVCQEGEELLLSLYLDAAVLDALQQNDPLASLHDGNLSDLCLVLEGVSHFVYLVWNAAHERSVTLLELELQAEVDKFVLLSLMLEEQSGEHPDDLHTRLFERVRYADGLDEIQHQRYQEANYLAAKYCWGLQRRYLRMDNAQQRMNDLRRFYRLHQAAKLRHINRLQ